MSDPTSTTDSLDQVHWMPQMTTCLNCILPPLHFNYKTALVLKSSLFLSLKNIWTMPIFHKQTFFLNHMTMNSSSSVKRLIHHLTISATRKVLFVKSYAKMTPSSLMPQTLAICTTPFHGTMQLLGPEPH